MEWGNKEDGVDGAAGYINPCAALFLSPTHTAARVLFPGIQPEPFRITFSPTTLPFPFT